MSREHWVYLVSDMPASDSEREIFAAAAALTQADRPAYLDVACAGRPEVRACVEDWLRTHDGSVFMQAGAEPALTPEIEAELARLKAELERLKSTTDIG